MAKHEDYKKPNPGIQRALAIGILIALCIALIVFTGGQNRLDEVRISRLPGSYASITDAEIIRASNLKMGAQLGAITEMKESVKAGVNSLGLVKFEGLVRVSGKCLEITVSARTPLAVIDSAGMYITIDSEGIVMDISKTLPTEKLLFVTGCDILTQEKGRRFSTREDTRLDDIIRIALAVRNGGYSDLYSELNVKDSNGMLLIGSPSLIVEIYNGDDIDKKLQMAMDIINDGRNTGRISISGDYAGYMPSEGS